MQTCCDWRTSIPMRDSRAATPVFTTSWRSPRATPGFHPEHFPPTNLLYTLRFKRLTMVVSCAAPGDTITSMSNIARNIQYKEPLSRNSYAQDAILLSGGGNDLFDRAATILTNPNRRTLANRRDAAAGRVKGCPIVTHTYDYATPRNEPARFIGFPLLDPWLFGALSGAEVPVDRWIDGSRHHRPARRNPPAPAPRGIRVTPPNGPPVPRDSKLPSQPRS